MACQFKPGWFLPGEAEEVAKYLKIDLQQLFNSRLAVDWWVDGLDGDIFLLSPVTSIGVAGLEFPFNPQGRCTFFTQDELCEIYPVRPHECREYMHHDSKSKTEARHWQTATMWLEHQKQICALLGGKPIAAEPEDMMTVFSLFF